MHYAAREGTSEILELLVEADGSDLLQSVNQVSVTEHSRHVDSDRHVHVAWSIGIDGSS
jgi:hypothetical protein